MVFWSWQSDSDPATNRNLIEDALKRALKAVRRESAGIEPVLDRDTTGLSGSPDISDSIFAKIASADILVADVTIINPHAKKPTSNPNVLIELGFAAATLGWDRIILVQNTAHGSPPKLPFDLRGRRVVPYQCASGSSDRAQAKTNLQGRLTSALRDALVMPKHSVYAGDTVPLWWGQWHLGLGEAAHGGSLFITDVGPEGFRFNVTVYHGSHTGDVAGFARLMAPNYAYARIGSENRDEICEITFRRRLDAGHRRIEMDEYGDCYHHHGMGVHFAGTFVRTPERLFDGGVLDEIDLQNLYRITGPYYADLSQRFQGLSDGENLDDFNASVTIGSVRGLYTIMEGIVMRSPGGDLWTAFIDGNVVRYFTTVPSSANKRPKTIEHWRERFIDKPVVHHSVSIAHPRTRLRPNIASPSSRDMGDK